MTPAEMDALQAAAVQRKPGPAEFDRLCRLYDEAQRAVSALAEEAPRHTGQEVVTAVSTRVARYLSDHRHHLGEQFAGWSR